MNLLKGFLRVNTRNDFQEPVKTYSVLRNKSPRHNKSPRSQPAVSRVGVAANRPSRGLRSLPTVRFADWWSEKHQCSISLVGNTHQCSISRVGKTPMLHFAGWRQRQRGVAHGPALSSCRPQIIQLLSLMFSGF